MSGDYETLEINQPKISYLKKSTKSNTEWLNELINKIVFNKKILASLSCEDFNHCK